MFDRLAPPAAGSFAVLDNQASPGASAGAYIAELGKSSPPLAVGVAGLAGLPLQAWVLVLTLIYLALQIAYLLFKWMRDLRRESDELQGKRERSDG